jgi:hypothetical protein
MLPEFLEEIPLALSRNIWFQHDRATGHLTRQVYEYLTANYNDPWNGQDGSAAWPSRSMDFIILDFFLWDYIKASTYSSSDDSEEGAAPTRHKSDIF